MIIGHGTQPIRIFLIADAAEGEDLRTGYALSGYKASMLSNFCKMNNLSYDNVYKTCLIKEEASVKPIKIDHNIYIQKNEEQVAKFGPLFIEEVNEIKPNLLIPLGELGFHYLTGYRNIRKFRGSVLAPSGTFNLNIPNVKVMPILGPYPYLYQEFKTRFITGIDFQKVPRFMGDQPIPDNFFKCWIAESAAALRSFLERSYKEDAILVFDIETYFGIPTCISFCFDGFESVCIPLIDNSIELDNRVLMMGMVAKVLASSIRKVNQNIKYDWRTLERWGFKINNVFGDTQLAAGATYCEFPKNLGFLTSIYTDLPYFKNEGKEFDPTKPRRQQFYLYNAKDSLAAHQIFTKQQSEIDELGVRYVYESMMKLLPIYKQADERGLLVDILEREKLKAKYYNLFEIECIQLRNLLNQRYINPLSHVQVREVVYKEIGYEPVRGVTRTKSNEPSTNEDSLMLLKLFGYAKRSPNFGPLILDCIINCRKLHKVIEILELPLWPDGHLRQDSNLAGTETGRSTGGDTLDQLLSFVLSAKDKQKIEADYLGHSLQTLGKHGFQIDGVHYGQDIRRMFVPTRGYSFVEIDLSGAEARVDAVLSGIFDLSYFDNPGIHKLTGSWCFNCAPSDIKKHTLVEFEGQFIDRYHVAKQVRHAGERNITAAGLVTKLLWGFTVRQGEAFLKQFHFKQPEIRQVFHRDVIKAIDDEHKLVAPNGRRRDFFDRPDKHTYNEAISQLPQAIVSDQTKFEGILPTFTQIDWAFMLAESHDSCLAEVPTGRELEYATIYKGFVERGIDFRKCSIPRDFVLSIPAEVSIGTDNLFEMKDVKL